MPYRCSKLLQARVRSMGVTYSCLLKIETRLEIPADTGDFRLLSRRAVEALKATRERSRFVGGLVSWICYRQTGVRFIREERLAGQTMYPFRKMLKSAIDGITPFSFPPRFRSPLLRLRHFRAQFQLHRLCRAAETPH
jgi:hypothetical protein